MKTKEWTHLKLNGQELGLHRNEMDFFLNAVKQGVGWWIGSDWHEPDQIDLDVIVRGKQFDNAGFEAEKHAILMAGRGKERKEIGRINLATLCALAMETVRLTNPEGFAKVRDKARKKG